VVNIRRVLRYSTKGGTMMMINQHFYSRMQAVLMASKSMI